MALNELRRHHPQLTVSQHIAPGYTIVSLPQSFDILTQPWRHRLPIYLHHLFPIHAAVILDSTNPDWQQLKQAVQQLTQSEVTIQVRCVIESDISFSASAIHKLLCDEPQSSPSYIPSGRILSIP